MTGPISKIALLAFLTIFAFGLSACATRSACGSAVAENAPLCIDKFSASVAADGRTISVSVGVTNTSASTERGKVWWLLSPPGEEPTWQHDIYQSAPHYFHVGSHGRGVVRWTEEILIGAGFYNLSAWIHVKDASGNFVHSDGKSAAALYIASATDGPTLLRHSQPTGAVAVKGGVNMIQSGSCPAIHSTVRLENASKTKQTIGLAWALITLKGQFPRWWDGPSVFSGGRQELTLGSGDRFEARIDSVLPANLRLGTGSYGLRIALDSGGTTEDLALVGDVWRVSTTETPKDHRTFLPSGSVMIGALEAPNAAVQNQKYAASLEVCNLTSQRQSAEVWWILGRVGDATPWQDPVAISPSLRVNLAPWGDVTATPTPVRVGARGRYELSAWVHVRALTGAFVHSDGLWLAEPVVLSAKPAA
jgi:hypothetical protein